MARDDAEVLDLDAAELPAPAPRRRRRPRRRLVAVVAGVVVLLALVVVARQAGGTAGGAAGGAVGGAAAEPPPADELFPSLVEGAPPGSDYPEAAVVAARDVVPGSARLLGRDGDLAFWVARDGAGSVCLVVRAGVEPLRLGGACAPLADAAVHGVALPEGDGVSAVLVPRGLDASRAAALAGPGSDEVAPSLWVRDRAASPAP